MGMQQKHGGALGAGMGSAAAPGACTPPGQVRRCCEARRRLEAMNAARALLGNGQSSCGKHAVSVSVSRNSDGDDVFAIDSESRCDTRLSVSGEWRYRSRSTKAVARIAAADHASGIITFAFDALFAAQIGDHRKP
jgi:hypothetical protein